MKDMKQEINALYIYRYICSSFLLSSTILINYTHKKKKNKHVHREITLENKTRLNKNNYVTKTMKNKHMKHLTKKNHIELSDKIEHFSTAKTRVNLHTHNMSWTSPSLQ